MNKGNVLQGSSYNKENGIVQSESRDAGNGISNVGQKCDEWMIRFQIGND